MWLSAQHDTVEQGCPADPVGVAIRRLLVPFGSGSCILPSDSMNRRVTVALALLVVLASDSGFSNGATTNDTSDRVSATIGAGVGDYRHAKLLVSSQSTWGRFP